MTPRLVRSSHWRLFLPLLRTLFFALLLTLLLTNMLPQSTALAKPGAVGNLLVTSWQTNNVREFSSTTGLAVGSGIFAAVNSPRGIVLNPTNNIIYVASEGNSNIQMFTTSGASAGTITGNDIWVPMGMTVDSSGNLYVANSDYNNPASGRTNINAILRFKPDGTPFPATGRSAAVFVAPGSGGLLTPNGVTIGPDGDLYVSSQDTDQVLQFVGPGKAGEGNFVKVFASGNNLDYPYGLLWGPDGNLYVSSRNTDRILRFNSAGTPLPASGKSGADFIPAGDPSGLTAPDGLFFDDANNLYVASRGSNEILRYSLPNGAYNPAPGQTLAHFVPDTAGLIIPKYMVFLPSSAPDCGCTVTMTSSPNPALVGDTITLTASVPAPCGQQGGTVTFRDGNTTLGTANLNASLQATFTIVAGTQPGQLAPGSHSLNAQYNRLPGTCTPTTSLTVLQQVNTPQCACTVTMNAPSPNPSVTGQTVTLSASVPAPCGQQGGTVTFKDGGTTIGTGTLNASLQATLQYAFQTEGAHSLTAEYTQIPQGGGTCAPTASLAVIQNVTAPSCGCNITMNVSPNPATAGQTTSIVATVPCGTPGGTVTFREGNTNIGTATLNNSNQATLNIALSVGTHSIIAVYNRTGVCGAAVSTAVNAQVNAAQASSSSAAANAPREVPEADTLLLLGGGLGGLATWLGWQKSKLRKRK